MFLCSFSSVTSSWGSWDLEEPVVVVLAVRHYEHQREGTFLCHIYTHTYVPRGSKGVSSQIQYVSFLPQQKLFVSLLYNVIYGCFFDTGGSPLASPCRRICVEILETNFYYTSLHNLVQTGLIVVVTVETYQVCVFIVFRIIFSSCCHGYYVTWEVHLFIAIMISRLLM
jgi:hypothetical protein